MRVREREREARRGTDATGNGSTTGEDPDTGDPHRREDSSEDPPPSQGTHTEHTQTHYYYYYYHSTGDGEADPSEALASQPLGRWG